MKIPKFALLAALTPLVFPGVFRPLASAAEATDSSDLSGASWIWAPGAEIGAGAVSYLRLEIELPSEPVEATVLLSADNGYALHVNGNLVAAELDYSGNSWRTAERLRIEKFLHARTNVIAIEGECLGGSAGVIAAVVVTTADGKTRSWVSDESWLATATAEANWAAADHDDSLWQPARVLGKMGCPPWGALAVSAAVTDPALLIVERKGGVEPARFSDPGAGYLWPSGIVFVGGQVPVHSTPAETTKFPIPGTGSYFEYDTPAPSVSGRQLYTLVPARPEGQLRLLHDAGGGIIASPACSYDGEEIIFAMVPEGEKFFKLFRIDADGTGLHRLTEGPWQDYEPAVLPDGRIAFASSRTGSRDEYHANTARSLFVLSADRSNIQPLTRHIVADSEPAVMADGRIAFVRHDNFMDRAKVETRIHAVRPDGSGGQTLLGADRGTIRYDRQTAAEYPDEWLRNIGFGSPAPLPDGRMACLSSFGPMIADVSLRESRAQERMPADAPLSDISPLPDGRLLCSTPDGVLGILHPDTGRVIKLTDAGSGKFHSVAFLGSRPKPNEIAGTVVPDKRDDDLGESGYLLCQNIFDSQQADGEWRRVKAVRILEGKPFTLRSAHHQYGHIGVEGIELGTVPLAPDGSFQARVPADRALAIQAVDAEGRAVVNELSWIYVRPGERRSCIGCHEHRAASPDLHGSFPLALLTPPVDLSRKIGGDSHRFRANNAANGGVLNLQFDRFREAASIDSYRQEVLPAGSDPRALPAGRGSEVARCIRLLGEGGVAEKTSAAQRLAIFRDRAAAPALVVALTDPEESVRLAAALALAACGTRATVPALALALDDSSQAVALAAAIGLEHLTGRSGIDQWKKWAATPDWNAIEGELIARMRSEDPVSAHLAIESLGHVASEAGGKALREFLESESAESLRTRLAAIRALGHLRDLQAIPLLAGILEKNLALVDVQPPQSHEFGWTAPPDHLGAAAAEALGWIGTPEAGEQLAAAYSRLGEFWNYTFRTGDHDWLMGCHSSIIHYRIAEALDAIGFQTTAEKSVALAVRLLKSVPLDTDRGLLYENDAFETVTGRLIQRMGLGPTVIDTCLAVLGDPDVVGNADLMAAVIASPPAKSVGPLSAESRAAQLLSVVCLQAEDAHRVRAAFQRHHATEPSRERSWTCFFLARTLGKLRDSESVAELRGVLDNDPKELDMGIPDPPNVFIHNAMTPLYRAAVADALGRIGDPAALPSLAAAVRDYDNAMEVREAAARSLGKLCEPDFLSELRDLATDYPEIATRNALDDAYRQALARITNNNQNK